MNNESSPMSLGMLAAAQAADLNPNVRVSDDAALSLDVRMTSAGLSNVLVGKPYSTALAAVLHLLMNMTTKHPDVKMRAGVAGILRNTANKMDPPGPEDWVINLDTAEGRKVMGFTPDEVLTAIDENDIEDRARFDSARYVVVVSVGRVMVLKPR